MISEPTDWYEYDHHHISDDNPKICILDCFLPSAWGIIVKQQTD